MDEDLLNSEELFALSQVFASCPVWEAFLRENAGKAKVLNREFTGCGFFTTVVFAKDLPDVQKPQIDWNFRHRALEHGGSFICWIDDHRSITFEAIAMTEDWPTPFDSSAFSPMQRTEHIS